MSSKAVAAAAAGFFVGIALAWSALASNPVELKHWRNGAAPSFSLPSTAGPDIDLDLHRGRVVLVHFFATWCEPCREELPALRRFVTRAPKEPVDVLAISVAEVDLRVRRFLETTPVNFPVLLDRDRSVAKAWNVSTLPSTVILDTTLKPRLVIESDFAWDRIEPRELVEMLGANRAPQSAKSPTGRKER